MIIQVGRYQVKKIDSYNFGVIKTAIVKEGHKMTGTVYPDRTLYYPRLDQALTALFDLMCLDGFGEAQYLEELCASYKGYKDEIIEQLKQYQEVK